MRSGAWGRGGRDQSESGTAVTVVFVIHLFVLDMNNRRASPGHKTKFNDY